MGENKVYIYKVLTTEMLLGELNNGFCMITMHNLLI